MDAWHDPWAGVLVALAATGGTRKYQQEWRARNPDYMRQKGREWRAKRKAQRLAIEQQTTESHQQ